MINKLINGINKPYTWVMADQILCSGGNFLATMLYARMLGPSGFGNYGLILFLAYLFMMMQQNFTGVTMAVNINKHDVREYGQYVYGKFIMLTAAVVLILILFLLLNISGISGDNFISVLLFIVCIMLHDLIRKYLIATAELKVLTGLDMIYYTSLFTTLFYLSESGGVSVIHIMFVHVISFVIYFASAYLTGAFLPFRPGLKSFISFFENERSSLKHLGFSSFFQWFNTRSGFYILEIVKGSKMVGVFNGYMSLVGIIHPLFISFDNYMLPRASKMFKEDGLQKTISFIDEVMMKASALILILFSLLFIFREQVILLVLGEPYLAQHNLIAFILAFYFLTFIAKKYLLLANIMSVQHKISKVYMMLFVASVIMAYPLIYFFNVYGLALLITLLMTLHYILLRLAFRNYFEPREIKLALS